MRDWIDKLKQEEDAKRREGQAHQETENRRARVAGAKAAGVWRQVIAQVESCVQRLRAAFPDDSSKDLQFLNSGNGFILRRNFYPYIAIEAAWVEEIAGVAVKVQSVRIFGSEMVTDDMEIRFRWAAEDSVAMIFDGVSHALPASLAEQLVRKVLVARTEP